MESANGRKTRSTIILSVVSAAVPTTDHGGSPRARGYDDHDDHRSLHLSSAAVALLLRPRSSLLLSRYLRLRSRGRTAAAAAEAATTFRRRRPHNDNRKTNYYDTTSLSCWKATMAATSGGGHLRVPPSQATSR